VPPENILRYTETKDDGDESSVTKEKNKINRGNPTILLTMERSVHHSSLMEREKFPA